MSAVRVTVVGLEDPERIADLYARGIRFDRLMGHIESLLKLEVVDWSVTTLDGPRLRSRMAKVGGSAAPTGYAVMQDEDENADARIFQGLPESLIQLTEIRIEVSAERRPTVSSRL